MTLTHDVLFYVPDATPLLVPDQPLPAGGAETQMVAVARELVRLGLRVGFVVYGDSDPPSADGLDVIVQRPPRLALPGARQAERTIRTALPTIRAKAPVVVQRNASVLTGIVALAARLTRRRFIYSTANVVDFDFGKVEPNRLRVALYHLGIRLADRLVVQTSEQVEMARERFGVSACLIPSIVEPAPPRTGTPSAFLWIGRLIGYKHPEAFLELAAAVPEAQFKLLGVPIAQEGARLATELSERARSLPNLELLEPRPRSQLGPLYDEAVAVVNTGDFEGMPNVFLEGWARGVPALALHHDPDDTISRWQLGAFANGDLAKLAADARGLWASRHDQRELAARCIAYVREQHSPQAAAGAWAELIRSAHA